MIKFIGTPIKSTVNYNSSLIEFRLNDVCWRFSPMNLRLIPWIQKVKVTLRLTISQSVRKSWCRAPSGAHDHRFITVWQVRSWLCGAPSLTRGRIGLLYMLMVLASAVFLGSESLGTHDHILLSQIWDFRFRRLLRLAGSRWRHSTPPPHGGSIPWIHEWTPYL
jgi:hypothetical protein